MARLLVDRGVEPGDHVGVSLERSPELVATLLAVWKAGAAFVALEPSWPAQRLEHVVRDANCRLVIGGVQSTVLENQDRIDISNADIRNQLDTRPPTTPPNVEPTPEDKAYLLYTSGSTGTPKGVVVGHDAVRHMLAAMHRRFPLDGGDTVLQKTAYGFDVAVAEIFQPLTAGASLAVLPEASDRDPKKILETLRKFDVTDIRLVPAALGPLCDRPEFEKCTSLERVIAAGEALTPNIRDRFYETSEATLHNLWGPTEACVYGTRWKCRRQTESSDVPIGYPLDNDRLFVLDDQLELVPPDMSAELYAAGPKLAWGYHGMPGKSAMWFIPNPYSDRPGERLYRTGDLVRWSNQGFLRFLGRRDRQVQVRGVRVELPDIEANLLEHPAVRECAVVPAETSSGRIERLTAHVVHSPARETTPSPSDYRQHLTDRIPSEVVPGTYHHWENLPTTASGKIDRSALRNRELPHAPDRDPDLGGEKERTIARLWSEHLKIDEIDRRDNFFDLGGHSLLAIRLQNDLEDEFGVDVPLNRILDHPTVAELAGYVERRADRSVATDAPTFQPSVVPLQRGENLPPLFVVSPMDGWLLMYRHLVDRLPDALPVYGLDLGTLELDRDSFPARADWSVELLARHYLEAIREFDPHGGVFSVSGWSFGGVVAFEMARQAKSLDLDVGSVLLLNAHNPACQPFYRARIPDETFRNVVASNFLLILRALGFGDETLSAAFDDEALTREELVKFLDSLELPEGAGGDLGGVDSDTLRNMHRIFERNEFACRRYRPDTIRTPTLFLGADPLELAESRDDDAEQKGPSSPGESLDLDSIVDRVRDAIPLTLHPYPALLARAYRLSLRERLSFASRAYAWHLRQTLTRGYPTSIPKQLTYFLSVDSVEKGWQPFVKARTMRAAVSAGHFSLLEPPTVDRIAETVEQSLQDWVVDNRN